MDDTVQYKATLQLLVPLVTQEIINERNVSQKEAFTLLYSSKLYAKLEDEETKLWHFSPKLLASILNEEIDTGNITFPEES